MTTKRRKKFVHEGRYPAEVELDCVDCDSGWAPYFSVADAEKLDQVREALKAGDLARAAKLARVFELTPVNV